MTTPDANARFDLFVLRSFLDQQTCEEIVTEMNVGPGRFGHDLRAGLVGVRRRKGAEGGEPNALAGDGRVR